MSLQRFASTIKTGGLGSSVFGPRSLGKQTPDLKRFGLLKKKEKQMQKSYYSYFFNYVIIFIFLLKYQ